MLSAANYKKLKKNNETIFLNLLSWKSFIMKILAKSNDIAKKALNILNFNKKNNDGFVKQYFPKDFIHRLEFEEDSFLLKIKQRPFNKQTTIYL